MCIRDSTIDFERMGQIAKACGAYLFVDMAHIAGLLVENISTELPTQLSLIDYSGIGTPHKKGPTATPE